MPRHCSRFVLLAIALLFVATGALAQTVTMPALSQVGSGLEIGAYAVTLSTGAHGGVTVHIESSDPTLAKVSNALATPGTTSFDVFLPNGSTSVIMYVHALEGVTGTATITASAPGFTSASRPAVVVVPAVDITGLLTSLDTLDPADPFQVRVGLPNAGGTAVGTPQPVRAGSSLTATVTNSDATFAQLVTTAVTGQSVTVPIPAGVSFSPSNVAAGGVAFDGLVVGSSAASTTIPGFTSMPSATQSVNVTQPTVSIPAITNVGSGLMLGASASLGASEHGGVTVHVESSNPAAVLVSPNALTVGTASIDLNLANGATSISFFVHGVEDVVSASDIMVSAPGFTSASRAVSVVQPAVDIVALITTIDTLDPADPFQVRVGLANAGNTSVITPEVVRAGSPGLTATLVSLTPSVGTLVTTPETDDTVTVHIAANQFSSPANVAGGGVAFDGLAAGSTVVLAQIPGFIVTTGAAITVSVTSPTTSIPVLGNVGSGLVGGATSATLSASQHGGVTMRIESSDSTLALVAPNGTTIGKRFFDTFLPNGITNVTFVVHALEGVVGTATISAHTAGFTDANRPVNIVQPWMDVVSLVTSIDTIDPNDPFQVRIGLPNAGNGQITVPQPLRAGSPGVDAVVVSSNGAVGQLVTTPLTDDTVSVHIAAGSFSSPATVATGGVAFHPVAGGIDTVSASIPGFLATTNASVSVTVTQPIITVNAIGDVGSGLQGSTSSAALSASQHGGVTVRVESDNPSVALVSPNASTAGTAFITTFVANGFTTVQFVVHGLENVVGTANIVVSAPGFANASSIAHIVEPAVDIVSLAATMDVDDPDDPFVVRVGLKNTNGSQVVAPQPVRVGGPSLVATVVSATPSVGLLVTTALTADTVHVSIAAGSFSSPATVAAGGVAFSGIAVGSTLVSARIPGFFPTGNATQSIAVTDLVVTMTPIGKVGAGLQSAPISATLGLAAHGGVTVHIQTSDPLVALVSPNSTTPGTSFFDVFVPTNTTVVPFFVQGLEDTVASATITASTPGFTSANRLVDIVQPGVQVEQLADTLKATDPSDPFMVRVGIPKPDLSEIETPQVIRAGGTPMTATVTCSNASVGVLTTNSENGASVSVTIPIGASQTANDVPSGGVEFDPLSPGTVLVSAAIPGVSPLLSSSTTCVVTAPDPTPVRSTPLELSLAQNVPNPFNPTTRIRFALPAASHVNVSVFDVSGRLVTTLVDRSMPTGEAEVLWNGRDARGAPASSGVYFYRLTTSERSLTKKMVLIK